MVGVSIEECADWEGRNAALEVKAPPLIAGKIK